jgi:hypothetical protein
MKIPPVKSPVVFGKRLDLFKKVKVDNPKEGEKVWKMNYKKSY